MDFFSPRKILSLILLLGISLSLVALFVENHNLGKVKKEKESLEEVTGVVVAYLPPKECGIGCLVSVFEVSNELGDSKVLLIEGSWYFGESGATLSFNETLKLISEYQHDTLPLNTSVTCYLDKETIRVEEEYCSFSNLEEEVRKKETSRNVAFYCFIGFVILFILFLFLFRVSMPDKVKPYEASQTRLENSKEVSVSIRTSSVEI